MIELKNLSKTFVSDSGKVEALKSVNVKVEDGEIFGIIGMSGAGKSTLVRCINLLEKPSEGQIFFDGADITGQKGRELRETRRKIAMIFQNFNLLMQRNCLKNVAFPLRLSGVKKSEAEAEARRLLALVGLEGKEKAYPAELSGGQKQRVAIARALATKPKVLLCDEATSALDPKTTGQILSLVKNINEELGITVIVITHQMSVVEDICKKVAILDGGEVVETGEVSEVFRNPQSAAAKKLVFPASEAADALPDIGGAFVRVVFNGASATGTPLIAKLAMEKGIAASIVSASTRNIGDKIFGNMLLGLKDQAEAKAAVGYFESTPDIVATEVTADV